MEHFLQRILGSACGTFGTVVLDADLLETNPAHQPAQKTASFGQVFQLIHHAAVHQAEIAGVGRNFDVGKLADEPVEAVGGKALEDGFALAFVTLCINHLVTFTPFLEHLVDEGGRILQVSVDNHYRITLGVVQSGAKSGLVPEIPTEVHQLVGRTCGNQTFQDFTGAVLGTVVHENQLVLDFLEFFFQNPVGFGNDFFFVIDGDDDGQEHTSNIVIM